MDLTLPASSLPKSGVPGQADAWGEGPVGTGQPASPQTQGGVSRWRPHPELVNLALNVS